MIKKRQWSMVNGQWPYFRKAGRSLCNNERILWRSTSLVFLTFSFLLFTFSFSSARPTSFTNVAKGLPVTGTFLNTRNIVDGDLRTYGNVNTMRSADNYIEIDLQAKLYLRMIKVYFEQDAFPISFSIDRKLDPFTGEQITANLLPAIAPQEGGNRVITVPLNNVAAKLLRFNFNKGLARGDSVRVAEIEVYPNMDVWPQAVPVPPPVLTDTEALVRLRSNLDFTGYITVQQEGPAPRLIQKAPTGFFTKEHAVFAHNLQPDTDYSFQMNFTDFHGNMAASPKMAFRTRNANLLLKKPVEGTFTAFQPDDPNYVKAEGNPILRVNDGNDSYFTSMVTSREPDTEDQYLIFDLGKKTPLKTLYVFWRALAYSKDYEIDISADAENWTPLLQGLSAEKGIRCYSAGGDPMLVTQHELENSSAQYLRLLHKKGRAYHVVDPKWKFIQIMEIKLF